MKGSIQKRGERCYRIRVDLGWDASGKRTQKSATVRGSRKEAEKRLAQMLNEIHQGNFVNAATMTLSAYLDYWLENYAHHLAARTYENYREYVEYYIKPGLGNCRLDQLQPGHIQAFYTELEKSGRKRIGGGLSPTTVFHVHQVLRGALRRAVQWQMLAKNPAEAVTAPPMAEHDRKTLTLDQVARLLEASRETRYYVPILLGLCTGMRRGEVAGLRWEDINVEKGVLSIRQTLVRVSGGRVEFKTPKTRTGRRSLPVPSLLLEAMAEERQRQEDIRATLGSSYNPFNLVVCGDDGNPMNPLALYKGLQRLLARLQLPRMAFHDLRHSHATHLLEQGVHPKIVSERLGHSDPAITLRVYSHVLDNIQQTAADQTDVALRQALERHKSNKKASPQ